MQAQPDRTEIHSVICTGTMTMHVRMFSTASTWTAPGEILVFLRVASFANKEGSCLLKACKSITVSIHNNPQNTTISRSKKKQKKFFPLILKDLQHRKISVMSHGRSDIAKKCLVKLREALRPCSWIQHL